MIISYLNEPKVILQIPLCKWKRSVQERFRESAIWESLQLRLLSLKTQRKESLKADNHDKDMGYFLQLSNEIRPFYTSVLA